MVSNITTGYPTDDRGRPFRRRRIVPAIITVVVLIVIMGAVWISALSRASSNATPVDCPQPTAPAAASGTASAAPAAPARLTVIDRDTMLGVAPAPLSTFTVRVLNASGQRGQAHQVLDDLTGQGFLPTAANPYGDDTVYGATDLNCVAQIRFGDAGKAAAASVWLAVPCAQVVNDGRKGTEVDVALGQHFTGREQSQDAQAALESLRSADPKDPKAGVDPSLIKAVHSGKC
ncbi:envelope integrity protein Cei [Williamsia sterculiae]|uniref:envelope integrity protein Cei n=1 Tax=Williamsia sterculiae TaxID=1344003 RepID=UPI0009702E3B|nr:envelope integrity protein Cei [Williamsia sterculiae]